MEYLITRSVGNRFFRHALLAAPAFRLGQVFPVTKDCPRSLNSMLHSTGGESFAVKAMEYCA